MPNLARPTLLEMLLKDEIRNERNQILQALHFIVKENFFDKEDWTIKIKNEYYGYTFVLAVRKFILKAYIMYM